MLNIIKDSIGSCVKMTELYDYLELEPTYYTRFYRRELLENPYTEEGTDYLYSNASNEKRGRGQKRQEFLITLDLAKKLCMVSKSHKGEEIRNWLVALTKKVELGNLVPIEMLPQLIRIIKVFFIAEAREHAMKKNQSHFFASYTGNKHFMYSSFFNWRNKYLHMSKKELVQICMDFCIENKKDISNVHEGNTIEGLLAILGGYDTIKGAVWDMLVSKEYDEVFALNLAEYSKIIAIELEETFERNRLYNHGNLFMKRMNESPIEILESLEITKSKNLL